MDIPLQETLFLDFEGDRVDFQCPKGPTRSPTGKAIMAIGLAAVIVNRDYALDGARSEQLVDQVVLL